MIMLRADESRFLNMEAQQKRCITCGHLMTFHSDHCCEFCCIPGCECRFGRWSTSKSKPDLDVILIEYISKYFP